MVRRPDLPQSGAQTTQVEDAVSHGTDSTVSMFGAPWAALAVRHLPQVLTLDRCQLEHATSRRRVIAFI